MTKHDSPVAQLQSEGVGRLRGPLRELVREKHYTLYIVAGPLGKGGVGKVGEGDEDKEDKEETKDGLSSDAKRSTTGDTQEEAPWDTRRQGEYSLITVPTPNAGKVVLAASVMVWGMRAMSSE